MSLNKLNFTTQKLKLLVILNSVKQTSYMRFVEND